MGGVAPTLQNRLQKQDEKTPAGEAVFGKRLQTNRQKAFIGLVLEETDGVLSNAP